MVNAFHPDMVQVMDPRTTRIDIYEPSRFTTTLYPGRGSIDWVFNYSWIPYENEGFSVNRLAWVVDDV